MKFRAPASLLLRRAQIVLMLATLVPTILMTGLGIILLAAGSSSGAIVAGVLVLAFCTSSLTGYILGSIFVSRGASLTRIQNDFLSAVSHELRTPVTSIRMFIDTLRQGRVSDLAERDRCLAIVAQELERLSGLVDKLLELPRLESGRQAFESGPVRVDELVQEAVTAFQAASLGSDVELQLASPVVNAEVLGDFNALTQALSNLLTNGWKHGSRDRCVVRLATRLVGSKLVELVVEDNGPGVPPEERARVFDRFERGRAATDRKVPGSGLGLAIARAVVVAHRGKIEVGAGALGGARFTVALPRSRGGPPAAQALSTPAAQALSTSSSSPSTSPSASATGSNPST
jgi:two-component system phosphate regulon sensor histidine kinase PhoR